MADRDNNRVQRFSPTGTFIGSYGLGAGTGPGQLRSPEDVAVDSRATSGSPTPRTSACRSSRPTGTFLATYDAAGALTTLRPEGLSFGPSGDLYIANNDSHVMRVREPGAPPPPPSQTGLPAPILGETVNVAPVERPGVRERGGGRCVRQPLGPRTQGSAVRAPDQRASCPSARIWTYPQGLGEPDERGGEEGRRPRPASSRRGLPGTPVPQRADRPAVEGRKLPPVRATEGQPSLRGPEPARDPAHARQLQRRFRTRGRYSAATVRGTIWDTIDRCDGTLTRVRRGVVVVRDFRKRRKITLRAGKSYLARAPW